MTHALKIVWLTIKLVFHYFVLEDLVVSSAFSWIPYHVISSVPACNTVTKHDMASATIS